MTILNKGKINSFFEFYTFPNVIPSNVIDKINSISNNYPQQDGKVGDGEIDPNIRRSIIKILEYTPSNNWLYDGLLHHIYQANDKMWNFSIDSFNDNIQYTEYYEADNGTYDWHLDIDQAPYPRKLSIVIQLSDSKEYEGGDLEISSMHHPPNTQITKIPKRKGQMVVFPSFLAHRVTPVTKGIRKSLVWWVGGFPFK